MCTVSEASIPRSSKASSNNPELSVTLPMCKGFTLGQLNMDWLLWETTLRERKLSWKERQSEINGDRQKKVVAEGEPECENVSITEGNQEDEKEGDRLRTIQCISWL